MAERISKEAFWELVKFKYPTHQIVFCTEKALQTLKGVIRYDKQIFPGRADNRERSLFSMLYDRTCGEEITSEKQICC